ncbi:MAG TPA: hypothetical protein VII09_10775, partial [Opitutaceae bacterium]
MAVGLAAAAPFLSKSVVGTGEAFNYSLSVADAVTQMRHGVVPPLAGQTEYAFNGRIHPLRNAPYLYYLAAGIDLATFRKLDFWELQNVSIVLSLVAAVFACYGGLRWATGCSRTTAFLLASAYGLSPALLAATHQLNLFMTVHAAVFVPLAVAACIRGCLQPSFSTDGWLAAALAAAWLAHPPVALWLTGGVIAVRGVYFLFRPSWRVLASGLLALAVGAALAAFVFASASTLSEGLGYFSGGDEVWRNFARVIANGVRKAFPATLLPVSRDAGALADLQFGYVPLILLAVSLVAICRPKRPGSEYPQKAHLAAALAVAVSLLLMVMVLPVPYVTQWLWLRVPGAALTMTTEWPMQRLLLVALGFTFFAAALVLPATGGARPGMRWSIRILVALASLWTVYQAEPFINRGFSNQWTRAATEAGYRPSNRDLTITSYAFVGLPPTFNYGVIDPDFEFRVLRDGRDEIASPLSAALATAPVVQRGKLTPHTRAHDTATSGGITLVPGHRYLLNFAFRIPPVHGFISVVGPVIQRGYALPEAGLSKGFGMLEGERRSIPLWTDSSKPELIEIHLDVTDRAVDLKPFSDFGDFTLQDVNMDSLPVRVHSQSPLRFTVESPEAQCTVETPRRYLEGYEAVVNGIRVTPLMSPYRQVMIPLPAGRSEVELRYKGPAIVTTAFWVSALSWVAFLLWRLCGSPVPERPFYLLARPLVWSCSGFAKNWAVSATVAVVVVVIVAKVVSVERQRLYLSAVGPMRIDFRMPYERQEVNQPLLVTGKPGAGVVIFVTNLDKGHIRFGADVWGALYQSDPVAIDFFNVQTLVVSDSALYPTDHPAVLSLKTSEREQLRGELRIELNGKLVLLEKCYGYESTLSQILVGETHMGSLTGPVFHGEILKAERLPIPRRVAVPWGDSVLLHLRFPEDRVGKKEPLASVNFGPMALTYYATYLADHKLRISAWSPDRQVESSSDIAFDPSVIHEVSLKPTASFVGTPQFEVACSFDGIAALGHLIAGSTGAPVVVDSGLNLLGVPGVEARFTGPEEDLVLKHNESPRIVLLPFGTVHLVVILPTGKTSQ